MTVLIPITSASQESAVTTSAATIATGLDTSGQPGQHLYAVTSSVDLFVAQGTNPTATVGAGSVLVPAGGTLIIDGANGAEVSAITVTGSGVASVTPLSAVR